VYTKVLVPCSARDVLGCERRLLDESENREALHLFSVQTQDDMEYDTLTHVLLFQVSPIAQALHKSLIHPLGSNAKRSDHQPLTRPSL
jgi:hypothetical protein